MRALGPYLLPRFRNKTAAGPRKSAFSAQNTPGCSKSHGIETRGRQGRLRRQVPPAPACGGMAGLKAKAKRETARCSLPPPLSLSLQYNRSVGTTAGRIATRPGPTGSSPSASRTPSRGPRKISSCPALRTAASTSAGHRRFVVDARRFKGAFSLRAVVPRASESLPKQTGR